MVEGARLESVCRFTPTEGSNPSLSVTRLRPEEKCKHVNKLLVLRFLPESIKISSLVIGLFAAEAMTVYCLAELAFVNSY